MLKHITGCGCHQCTTVVIPDVAETPKVLYDEDTVVKATPVGLNYDAIDGEWEVVYQEDYYTSTGYMPLYEWRELKDATP